MRLTTVLLIILGIAVARVGWAQPYPSVNGRFMVNQIEGCANPSSPFTVNITIGSSDLCDASNSCDMDFEGNSQTQNLVFSHTYTQPGVYRLRVIFQAAGSDEITITVVPSIEPAFDIYSCGGNQVQVKVTDTNYDQYSINYNDGSPLVTAASGLRRDHIYTGGPHTISVRGVNTNAANNCAIKEDTINVRTLAATRFEQLEALNASQIKLDFAPNYHVQQRLFVSINNTTTFQQLENEYNVATTTLTGLTPDNNYYCFRLDAVNPCTNASLPSQLICSANFDITPQNNVNKLFWNTGNVGVSDFAITRTPTPSLTATAAQNTKDDTDISCGTQYTYQLLTNYNYGARSISLSKTVTAISTNIPAVIDNISALTEANSVTLDWVQDPAYTAQSYTILKAVGGTSTTAGTSTTPSFTDKPYTPQPPACYTIGYGDVCGNNSPASVAVCPIVLTASLQGDNAVNLSWSAFTGWKNGVQTYTLEKYSPDGQLLGSVDMGTATAYNDPNQDFTNQTFLYQIIATPIDGGIKQSTSNTVEIIKEPNLYYPSGFTPNNDGLNDAFKVFSQYTATFELRIFNRWGELLFNTDDMTQGWDGTYKGNLMPEGTYVFRAKITDLAGRTFDRSGSVILLKK